MKLKRLTDTVEADETCFLCSNKGPGKPDRPARKRGLSDEKIPVPIARDDTTATTDHILADRSATSIKAVLGPVVDTSAILVSDGAHAYRAFASDANIVHVALNLI